MPAVKAITLLAEAPRLSNAVGSATRAAWTFRNEANCSGEYNCSKGFMLGSCGARPMLHRQSGNVNAM